MPVDSKNLDNVLALIKKNLGDDSVRMGDEYPVLKRVPTGLPALDSLIGGGLPLGRWVQFYGGYGSAKTLMCLHTIREAQKMGLTVAYYDIEKQFSKQWAEGVGIDTSKLVVFPQTEMEKIAGIMEASLDAINVHVMDSLGAAVSVDELAAKPEDWLPGINARAWGKFVRRVNHAFDPKENMILMVNQTREVFGKKGSEQPVGGRSISYMSSLDLYFKKSSWLFYDKNGELSETGKKTDEEGEITPDGLAFKVRINKSRVCEPFGVVNLRLEKGQSGNFDKVWNLARAAIASGLVTRKGAWYELDENTKFQGESALKEYIRSNPEFQAKIQEEMGLGS